MIVNPILPGFNPDPSILRLGSEYYIATSTFEWFPAIAIYHSTNLKDWKLITHVIQDDTILNLKRLPSAKGVWAPCLTYNHKQKLFYVVFSLMYSHNARYFDVDNFLLTAPSIYGPWSVPIYLHSVGFDPSFFHDDDGRQYVVCLEWELRNGPGRPGAIVLQEYDGVTQRMIGPLKRISNGFTRRGCIEGPHIYKYKGLYYLLLAEGGTGYGHCVTLGRSASIWGPYEGDPGNPILSASEDFDELDNDHYLKPHRYNPKAALQKTGHASIVATPDEKVYMAHLCARPFTPELRCTLGRETALQRMYWTNDGWLRKKGGKLPDLFVEEPEEDADHILYQETGKQSARKIQEKREDFENSCDIQFVSPRCSWKHFASLTDRPGYLRIFGRQSLCSLDEVALVARRLISIQADVRCAMEFIPTDFRHSAGLVIYYDNMNHFFLRLTRLIPEAPPQLMLTQIENGQRKETEGPFIEEGKVLYLRLTVHGRELCFFWTQARSAEDNVEKLVWHNLGSIFDVSVLSDEYCTTGEFTGTFVGIACVDTLNRHVYADFDWFEYREGYSLS
ncbi:MAG TPA: glycoside hydrolase family 43 protein [Termitinemataceae bacterium]|mgnify:FL=1|nr:glycoside hydrolase family 43 protein [Termitinemataceae bacterium]